MKPVLLQPTPPIPVGAETNKTAPANRPETVFSEILDQSLGRVNRLHNEADSAARDLTNGRRSDIHQTMIATEKAGIAFEMLMQIRNKLINAYETVMRLSV